jgi:hypothetical protein
MRHMPFVMRAEGDGHCAFVVLFVVVGRRLFVCIQEMGRLLAAVHPGSEYYGRLGIDGNYGCGSFEGMTWRERIYKE